MGIYSGAGGYSAYRPGLVGLTPSQLREMKKFEEEPCYERAIERLCVMWKIVSLVLLLEPSRGPFLLCAGVVVSSGV